MAESKGLHSSFIFAIASSFRFVSARCTMAKTAGV